MRERLPRPPCRCRFGGCGAARPSLRARQRDDERRAAAVGVGGAHAAAVRVDDAGHDRQPEPGAGLAALAPALGAPEALEERVRRRRSGGRGRGRGPRAAPRRPRGRRRPRSGCRRACGRARCGGGWRAPGAAGGRRRARAPGRRRGPRSRGPGAVARASSTASRASVGEVDLARAARRRSRRAARASAGPRRARPCAPPRPRSAASPSRRPRRQRAAPMRKQLGVAADRGQRRAQLVRGVGDELAQPVLARAALGERVLEPVEHALSATPRRPTSVRSSVTSTRWERSPPAIRPAVWPMRSSGSRPMRTTIQRDDGEHEQHADDHEALDEQQPVERAVDVGERDGDDGEVAVAERGGDERGSAARPCRSAEIGLRLADLDARRGSSARPRRSGRSRRGPGGARRRSGSSPVGAGRQADAGAAAARRPPSWSPSRSGDRRAAPMPCSASAPATAPAPLARGWSTRS